MSETESIPPRWWRWWPGRHRATRKAWELNALADLLERGAPHTKPGAAEIRAEARQYERRANR